MSLAFRLGTVAFTMGMMVLALYILAAGILGRKMNWKSLGIFLLCGEAAQWLTMLIYAFTAGTENAASDLYDTVCYTVMALILGFLLFKACHIPFLHTFTASVLSTFITNTANSLMVQMVEEYAPLFDRQHVLAFVRLYVPYTLTVVLAWLTALILKKSGFYRYFSACLLYTSDAADD